MPLRNLRASKAALGGSDDHDAGASDDAFVSPIGSPTTMVFAHELSVPALLDGLREKGTREAVEAIQHAASSWVWRDIFRTPRLSSPNGR